MWEQRSVCKISMGTAFPTVPTHTKHWSGDFIKYFLETADSPNQNNLGKTQTRLMKACEMLGNL